MKLSQIKSIENDKISCLILPSKIISKKGTILSLSSLKENNEESNLVDIDPNQVLIFIIFLDCIQIYNIGCS